MAAGQVLGFLELGVQLGRLLQVGRTQVEWLEFTGFSLSGRLGAAVARVHLFGGGDDRLDDVVVTRAAAHRLPSMRLAHLFGGERLAVGGSIRSTADIIMPGVQ